MAQRVQTEAAASQSAYGAASRSKVAAAAADGRQPQIGVDILQIPLETFAVEFPAELKPLFNAVNVR